MMVDHYTLLDKVLDKVKRIGIEKLVKKGF